MEETKNKPLNVVKDDMDILAEELQSKINMEYRTDGMTFPAIPVASSTERNKDSDIERMAILNTALGMDAVVDAEGTTKQELVDRLFHGKLPNSTDVEQPIKHEVSVVEVDGEKTIIIKAPDEISVEVINVLKEEKKEDKPKEEFTVVTEVPTPSKFDFLKDK